MISKQIERIVNPPVVGKMSLKVLEIPRIEIDGVEQEEEGETGNSFNRP